MLRKTMTLLSAALMTALPLATVAETLRPSEVQMLNNSMVSLQQAADAALVARQGRLAALSFDDENDRAAWEAVVIAPDGQSWTVMIDANSGDVFASGLSSGMGDDDEGEDDDA